MEISRNEEEDRIATRTEDEEETETETDGLTIAEQTGEFVCLHCHKPIPTNEIPSTKEGIKYHKHPYWEEKYCPSHDGDGTAKCCGCERLQACGTKHLMLADNRWLCVECNESTVMDTDESQSLHFEIREFFKGLNMKVEKVFPLILVDQQSLNKAEEENQYGVVTRGICMSEEKIVTRESQRFVRECNVTAILILYGLPRLLTGYLLAHEMMHAYLRLKGYRNLKTVLEEGICQVLGRMWLESQRFSSSNASSSSASSSSSSRTPPPDTTSTKGDQSDFEKKLLEFCIHQIETDESPIYGDGFRKVNEMLVSNHYNLKDTLKGIVIASKGLQDSMF
ncbi:hypothetical protein N665_0355s0013 [Sinapis alba]|nr:hypothetical protein N665_0355s0013 [Sinapis alba]